MVIKKTALIKASKLKNNNKEKDKQLFNLVHAIRIGRKDFSDIAKRLDKLKVPFTTQNRTAYLAIGRKDLDAYQIIRLAKKRRKWKWVKE